MINAVKGEYFGLPTLEDIPGRTIPWWMLRAFMEGDMRKSQGDYDSRGGKPGEIDVVTPNGIMQARGGDYIVHHEGKYLVVPREMCLGAQVEVCQP